MNYKFLLLKKLISGGIVVREILFIFILVFWFHQSWIVLSEGQTVNDASPPTSELNKALNASADLSDDSLVASGCNLIRAHRTQND